MQLLKAVGYGLFGIGLLFGIVGSLLFFVGAVLMSDGMVTAYGMGIALGSFLFYVPSIPFLVVTKDQ